MYLDRRNCQGRYAFGVVGSERDIAVDLSSFSEESIPGPLHFHLHFRMSLSVSTKKPAGILIRIG